MSIAGLRRRTYAVDLPASPIPETIVITRGTYVSSVKSSVEPTGCHGNFVRSKTGPSAKPSAGSAKAAVAAMPRPWAPPVIRRRRVTVSPSKAPGMPRSAV